MIEREDDGDIAVLRMVHGPVNAMDTELCEAIGERFRALADDPATAVVITGSGRTFSAGADLRRYLDEGEPYVARFLPALAGAFRAMFELTKPVVAAVNGHAIAGGCVLAATADVTVMAEGKGRIGVPELKVGVPFPRVALEVLRHAVGDIAARRLVVGALTYPPAEAQAIGLVDHVVPAEEVLGRAVEAARALASGIPADTFAVTKTQLRREHLERAARYGDEDDAVARLWDLRSGDGWTRRFLDAATGR